MTTKSVKLCVAVCAGLIASGAPSLDAHSPFTWSGAAFAQTAVTPEKEAFEAAKELGTVEAWDAFLSNYPTGFHADLARAYVKKLGEAKPGLHAAPAATYDDFPVVAGSWGGVVRDKPGKQFRQIDSLEEGEEITLMGRSDVMEDGYPWFKIAYRDGKIGFKWGGILCAVGTERPDVYKVCPNPLKRHVEQPRREEPKREEPKKVQQACAKGRVRVDGRCVLKQDASTHCGPGFRLQGNKCVAGYKPPKPQEKLPSWQIEAIKKGCPKGMGWNAQEGCHEND
jgi:hypothetical protein